MITIWNKEYKRCLNHRLRLHCCRRWNAILNILNPVPIVPPIITAIVTPIIASIFISLRYSLGVKTRCKYFRLDSISECFSMRLECPWSEPKQSRSRSDKSTTEMKSTVLFRCAMIKPWPGLIDRSSLRRHSKARNRIQNWITGSVSW